MGRIMKNSVIIPADYTAKLNSYDLQLAITKIKIIFMEQLSIALNLKRVSAPLFVKCGTGVNDNLSGKERPVTFDVPAIDGNAEIVHSLAKWKRIALKNYGFCQGEGLLTDMNAIRRDESLDNMHSIYVDQWDWEKIIGSEQRTVEFLQNSVQSIVQAIAATAAQLKVQFTQLDTEVNTHVAFITSQQLEDLYPDMTPEQREHAFTKQHKTAFIMQIGDKLKSGIPHGTRSPDYDDWSLNGDLLVWNDLLQMPMELSSMGIRVDGKTLYEQLQKANCLDRKDMWYHKMLLDNQLPLTVGGGIGQSRLCMYLLQCAHIGEVQSSLWDSQTMEQCAKHGIKLL